MNFNGKVERSKDVIKKAIEEFGNDRIAAAWTGGKDSTVVLGLVRETFNEIPIPVVFVDTSVKFKETYEFIDRIKKEWNL
ncbi:MAG TPA: phosphoadenosine phosphosulfate reductase, partial [Candidatus Altiarchaeales archaeon]|nr:phosphoadenosine phosphosulfate reductase [Candidatus Altiarchaeales archaeon]